MLASVAPRRTDSGYLTTAQVVKLATDAGFTLGEQDKARYVALGSRTG